jgi:hypothetical protein
MFGLEEKKMKGKKTRISRHEFSILLSLFSFSIIYITHFSLLSSFISLDVGGPTRC